MFRVPGEFRPRFFEAASIYIDRLTRWIKRQNVVSLEPWMFGSPGRTRTSDMVVNSHPLYRLSYRGAIRESEYS